MAAWSFNLHTQLNITNWTTMVCINCLILYFVFRFTINPRDKIIEQRTRGYFIAGSSPEVKRYKKLVGPFVINGNLSSFFFANGTINLCLSVEVILIFWSLAQPKGTPSRVWSSYYLRKIYWIQFEWCTT